MDVIYRYDPYQPIEHRPIADAAEAIDYLERGHDRYLNIVNQVHREILGRHTALEIVIPSNPLSLGLPSESGAAPVQTPFALVLGCSDARVPIELIFDQSPNDLFVIRVAGNVLGVECLGSIDYAVSHLGKSLKLVVVLGHSTCGAVTAAVDSYSRPKTMPKSPSLTHSGHWSTGSTRPCAGRPVPWRRVGGAAVARTPSIAPRSSRPPFTSMRPSPLTTSSAS